MFYDTVGSENGKARLRTRPLRTVGTQRPYGSTVVSTVQQVNACVDNTKRKISRSFPPRLPQYGLKVANLAWEIRSLWALSFWEDTWSS